MQLSRPYHLFFQCRERARFSLASVLAGGDGLERETVLMALAPALEREVEVTPDEIAVVNALPPHGGTEREALAERFGAALVDRLISVGLLIGDHDAHQPLRARDRAWRECPWWAPAALAQSFGRWENMDIQAQIAEFGELTWRGLVDAHGLPPGAEVERRPGEPRLDLPAARRTALDELFAGRSTCRNFATDVPMALADLSDVLQRVFGAQAAMAPIPGVVAHKRNSPSGGGLHPIDAYVLAQNVSDCASGLYHYLPGRHALEPMRALSADVLRAEARQLLAGQAWFATAPVMIVLAARFDRNFWKYRNNSKAWRVIQLDAGHLSQNLYLGATEMGYGAFVTAAINDDVAERLCELDGIRAGAVAVCGFGKRSGLREHIEFDPLGKAVR